MFINSKVRKAVKAGGRVLPALRSMFNHKKSKAMYPIKIKLSKDSLNEFQTSEYPSYEDYLEGRPEAEGDVKNFHQYEILARYKSQILIKNKEELRVIWFALCSGTFQIHKPRSTKIIADKLKPYVEKEIPNILKEWPYPNFH